MILPPRKNWKVMGVPKNTVLKNVDNTTDTPVDIPEERFKMVFLV